MNFWDVFGEMLVILFAIAAGYAANRLGYLGGEADQKVSKLLLNITMPAMIVAAVITGEELPELGTILSILEVGVVFYLLEAVFALVVPRFLPGTQGQKGVWRYALAFPNVGFIGYPVAVALCLVLRALGIDSLVLGIAVTQMAMPVAVNGTLLSMEYGGDTECMAQITFLTTAASIVTIPIVAVLLL